jgi:NAD(P)H-dependent FMN reductase
MRFLGISGSLRRASTNRMLLEAFAQYAPSTVMLELFDGLDTLPIFNPDLEETVHAPVERLASAVAAADGLVIACPEYAHGIPGGLKNALDWLVSRSEIPGKPVMVVHASARSSTSREHLREVLKTMSCKVFDGGEFECHLIGKPPAEITDLLEGADIVQRMAVALAEFAAFCAKTPD